MGGEMAGTFMAASQVQVHRRTIHRVRAEFGAREGEYGSVLYLAGALPADAEANFAHAWSHVQKGANGMLASEVVANGPSTFSAASVTWTDSLDSMLAAAADNFADPVTQEIMAATNTTVVGRVLTRRLI